MILIYTILYLTFGVMCLTSYVMMYSLIEARSAQDLDRGFEIRAWLMFWLWPLFLVPFSLEIIYKYLKLKWSTYVAE